MLYFCSMSFMVKRFALATCVGLVMGMFTLSYGCESKPSTKQPKTTTSTEVPSHKLVDFSADSAYAFVARQVAFGPRVPGTAAHSACGDWMVNNLRKWADRVTEQTATVKGWDGVELPMRNIIAQFNPEASRRIMLSAHWYTRPMADEDTERRNEPIAGANDGGSGVGVLMELARQMSLRDPGYGVDLVFFDVEDYGNAQVEDSYCLGSQYWARKAVEQGYSAEFGILLDMVGAEGAYFYREGISMYFAKEVVAKVWDAAARTGHRSYFVFNEEPFPPLTDDHYYVNRIAGIPTIDIIQYDRDNPRGFGDFWHTHQDDMPIISKRTLQAVGETLSEVLYASPD